MIFNYSERMPPGKIVGGVWRHWSTSRKANRNGSIRKLRKAEDLVSDSLHECRLHIRPWLLKRYFRTHFACIKSSISLSIPLMMLEAVEKRFRATRAPNAIVHLSDNGSAYRARDTRIFARALNLVPCFTPVASPQSNAMSEAFVKTLKRDYIRISQVPDAQTALRLIDGWIEDYNEIHPHSALKMASPRQFIRAKST